MNKIAIQGNIRMMMIRMPWDRLLFVLIEKKVASKLDKLGIENYVAIQMEQHQ